MIGRVSRQTISMEDQDESAAAFKDSGFSQTEIRAFNQTEYEAWLLNSGWEIVRERMYDNELPGQVRQIEESGEQKEIAEAYIGEQRAFKQQYGLDQDEDKPLNQ